MSKFKKYFIFIFISLIINQLSGQSIFRGGVVAGFNAAQLDGDLAAGYHKLGLNIGLRSTIDLGKRFELQTEILFSQRGARTTANESLILRSCTLNYLEVPVLLNIRDWQKNDEGGSYWKVHFSAGLSYGRLFRATANGAFTHYSALNDFAKNDVSMMAGIGYYINRHWGLSCRIARSINHLYDYRKFSTGPNSSLKGHYVTFLTTWLF